MISPQAKRLRDVLRALKLEPIGGIRTERRVVCHPDNPKIKWAEYGPAMTLVKRFDETTGNLLAHADIRQIKVGNGFYVLATRC